MSKDFRGAKVALLKLEYFGHDVVW